ncbi:MAG: signal recognition particle-docking protein FtsY [Candidatus Micrarchaeota archaeon]
MFDFLKKKINDFVGTFTHKEEKVAQEEAKAEIEKTEPKIIDEKNPVAEAVVEPQKPIEDIGPPVQTPMMEAATENVLEELESAKPIEIPAEKEETIIPKPEEKRIVEIKKQEKIAIPQERGGTEEPKKAEIHGAEGKKIVEIEKIEEKKPKIIEIKHISPEKEGQIMESAAKVQPKTPEKIAQQREKIEEKIVAEEMVRESTGGGGDREACFAVQQTQSLRDTWRGAEPLGGVEDEADKEIEELVGGTLEGEIRREARAAEKKIVEEKQREEIARKVFGEKKEEFLAAGKERDLKPNVGLFSKLKGLITGEVEIKEADTDSLFEQFEMALLESDVSYPTAQALISDLKTRLVGRRVRTGQIGTEVKKEIAFALASVLQTSKSDFYEKIKIAKSSGGTPFIIVFVGPNGMGKTTTIAKIAHNLKKHNLTAVISASDTFRAAAIEQAEHHGAKLGLKVIKHRYGADPAAVAFDAINHAKAHKIDVVLIDTAGRQDTNANLLSEMQKIVRVVKPHLKVFVAEAIAGTSLVNQVKAFNEKLGIDGIILTKLDCDAKGGGSLSIAYECKLPVYFVGTGQGYDDLLEFNEEWIVKNIMAE